MTRNVEYTLKNLCSLVDVLSTRVQRFLVYTLACACVCVCVCVCVWCLWCLCLPYVFRVEHSSYEQWGAVRRRGAQTRAVTSCPPYARHRQKGQKVTAQALYRPMGTPTHKHTRRDKSARTRTHARMCITNARMFTHLQVNSNGTLVYFYPDDPCAACPPGKMKNVAGASPCQDCEPGHYQPHGSQTMCIRCPPGSFESMSGSSACKACPPGTMGNVTVYTETVSMVQADGSYEHVEKKHALLTLNATSEAIACPFECSPGTYSPGWFPDRAIWPVLCEPCSENTYSDSVKSSEKFNSLATCYLNDNRADF